MKVILKELPGNMETTLPQLAGLLDEVKAEWAKEAKK
jgi:hypothetical protein